MAQFSEEAIKILNERYLKKDDKGNVIETPTEMLERVAECVSSAEGNDKEKWKKKFLSILDSLEFLPNSPTLMNAGKADGQLSACFTLPVEDNLSAIFEVIKESSLIHKTGGGCFKKGTKVLDAKGKEIEIEKCFKNQPVLCYNTNSGVFEEGVVIDNFQINSKNKGKVEIEFDGGNKVICTSDHPFRVAENGIERWVKAVDLKDDMDIIAYDEIS